MRSTVVALNKDELSSLPVIERQTSFTNEIENAFGNYSKEASTLMTQKPLDDKDIYHNLLFDIDDHSEDLLVQEVDPNDLPVVMPYHDDVRSLDAPCTSLDDTLLRAEVTLPTSDGYVNGKVKRRKVDPLINLLQGTYHDNPILDSRVYEVEMPDGTYNERRRITTRGYDLNILWTDGTTSWIPLKDMKESKPLEVTEYITRNSIGNHPVFAWEMPQTIRRKESIVKQVTHRLAKEQYKFGIKVPNSVDEALQMDKNNGNNLWHDAIQKELKNVLIAFRMLEEGEQLPVGSKQIPYHIIFDVKLDLTRKVRLVAGGHRNKDVLKYTTFFTVASRDSVQIMFLVAALNGLKILSTDVGNAYLNAECREKVHVKCGTELFGPEHVALLVSMTFCFLSLMASQSAMNFTFNSMSRDRKSVV